MDETCRNVPVNDGPTLCSGVANLQLFYFFTMTVQGIYEKHLLCFFFMSCSRLLSKCLFHDEYIPVINYIALGCFRATE